MTCMQIHQAISARLDGEDPGLDESTVYAHLAGCAGCREFSHRAEGLHRSVRLAPAPQIPDLTPGILTAIGAESLGADSLRDGADGEPDTNLALRWILVAIAVAQIAVAIPALVLGSDAGLPVHAARHIGSFDVALGVGFLYAAWKPSRIPGLLPVVAALVVCLVGSSLLDVADGSTKALGEVQHVFDFVGLAVVWLLSRPTARRVQLASSQHLGCRVGALAANSSPRAVVALAVVFASACVGLRAALSVVPIRRTPADRRAADRGRRRASAKAWRSRSATSASTRVTASASSPASPSTRTVSRAWSPHRCRRSVTARTS